MQIISRPSQNFGNRKPIRQQANFDQIDTLDTTSNTPSCIVYHATYMNSAEEALERLCDPNSCVSCHYLIAQNGTIWQLVDLENRAWHAGQSWWRGIDDINSASVGIELDYPDPFINGDEYYCQFSNPQIDSLISLVQFLASQFPLPKWGHVGHQDIAPARKYDPGLRFPWHRLSQHGFGIIDHRYEINDIIDPNNPTQQYLEIEKLLDQIGYDPSVNLEVRLKAFQNHFQLNMPDTHIKQYNAINHSIQIARRILQHWNN